MRCKIAVTMSTHWERPGLQDHQRSWDFGVSRSGPGLWICGTKRDIGQIGRHTVTPGGISKVHARRKMWCRENRISKRSEFDFGSCSEDSAKKETTFYGKEQAFYTLRKAPHTQNETWQMGTTYHTICQPSNQSNQEVRNEVDAGWYRDTQEGVLLKECTTVEPPQKATVAGHGER